MRRLVPVLRLRAYVLREGDMGRLVPAGKSPPGLTTASLPLPPLSPAPSSPPLASSLLLLLLLPQPRVSLGCEVACLAPPPPSPVAVVVA
eukprot:2380904-Rhodomonas_salina.1